MRMAKVKQAVTTVGEDTEMTTYILLGGYGASLENNLVIPQNSMWSSNSTPIFNKPKKIESVCPYKLYINIHSLIIDNSQMGK